VPEYCTIGIDVRARTEDHGRRLVDEIGECCRTVAARDGCTVEVDSHQKYADYRFAPEDTVVALATRALRAVGREAVPVDGGGGADANVFNARGLPCLNLANGMAAIHTSDEHIAVDDLDAMVAVTLALVDAARA
jgi:tripeptide aminopeptidase